MSEVSVDQFTKFTGVVCPLERANVDTDAIIPKQFLKSIYRTGFGPYLFDAWRYLDVGEPGKDCSTRPLNPEFILNDPIYQQAQILLTRDNFGCGSSREHAPWALADYGFKVLIAPSFADIFFNNCFKNGILPIILPNSVVTDLFTSAVELAPLTLTVDLQNQQLLMPQGAIIQFPVDEFRKRCLLEGLDDIDLTLRQRAVISSYEQQHHQQAPWLCGQV
ncbi:3-isopropylmalate dehydratase [Achromatium sp. WMS2]|nr:3-isopropylmalate dehydratase [Achromatium sp. WMS2]